MKNNLYLLLISLFMFSCSIKKIDFNNEYKFNTEIRTQIEKDTIPWKHQIAASDYAMKGNYLEALKQWEVEMGTRNKNFSTKQIDSINNTYKSVSASDYIIKQAKTNKIVIINEAHHNSMHRAFTKSILKSLYDIGYTNLGLEAITPVGKHHDYLLMERKYPIKTTGFYTKDPQFGNLIREALEIGFTIFPYEKSSNANGKEREVEQAENITKFINENKNEKYLIHCGFDHVLEGNHSHWEKAMAGRLKEYTGINPFTITQVVYSEKSEAKYNHKMLKALSLKQSSVLIDKNEKPYKYIRGESWADIAIFHPNTLYINGRPNWAFKNGKKSVKISLEKIKMSYPLMIFAFNEKDDIDTAVPIDIIELEQKSESNFLALKKGKYQIVITNMKKDAVKMKLAVD